MSQEFEALYAAADAAGKQAVEEMVAAGRVVPMIVGTPKTFMGNTIDMTKPVEYVEDGVCGFAWINLHPATTKFARWLKAKGLARSGTYSGLSISVRGYNQSMQKKEEYARAFAKVLKEAGYRAYMESRLD